jgi:hypothetical protein
MLGYGCSWYSAEMVSTGRSASPIARTAPTSCGALPRAVGHFGRSRSSAALRDPGGRTASSRISAAHGGGIPYIRDSFLPDGHRQSLVGTTAPLRACSLLDRNERTTLGSTFFRLSARFSTRCQLSTAKKAEPATADAV